MNWKILLFGKWNWKRPFYSLTAIYLILCLIAVSCADRLIFVPPPASYATDLEAFHFIENESNSRIASIHLKARAGAPTLIYSHGNAEDIGQSMEIFRAWHARGLGVIAYDYPGYGLSPGRATEDSSQQAIRAAWDYALASGIKPSSLVIVGRSIGSGPSVWLASSTEPAGLVLISPLKSAFSVVLPFPILPGDRFPNLKRIRDIDTPLLVIHGKNDNVIPFSHGVAIHEDSPAENKSLIPIPNAGHNDLFYVAGDEIIEASTTFAKEVSK